MLILCQTILWCFIMNVSEVTNLLISKGLVKDINGTRRFIRKGELIAEKTCNREGYQIDKQALESSHILCRKST